LPEGKPGNESGELAVCNETRQEQIQNQRKRTKKISAAAESDFIIAGKQAEFAHSTQAKEHKLCKAADRAGNSYTFVAEDIRVSSKAGRAGKSRQANADLQEIKFKNSDPTPTRPTL